MLRHSELNSRFAPSLHQRSARTVVGSWLRKAGLSSRQPSDLDRLQVSYLQDRHQVFDLDNYTLNTKYSEDGHECQPPDMSGALVPQCHRSTGVHRGAHAFSPPDRACQTRIQLLPIQGHHWKAAFLVLGVGPIVLTIRDDKHEVGSWTAAPGGMLWGQTRRPETSTYQGGRKVYKNGPVIPRIAHNGTHWRPMKFTITKFGCTCIRVRMSSELLPPDNQPLAWDTYTSVNFGEYSQLDFLFVNLHPFPPNVRDLPGVGVWFHGWHDVRPRGWRELGEPRRRKICHHHAKMCPFGVGQWQ